MENSNTFYKMRTQVTHIDCPKEWVSDSDWDSHRPILWLVIEKTNPNFVVECGCGYGSTLLLNKYCNLFASYETNGEWFDRLSPEVPYSLFWVEDWDSMAAQDIDLLFLDCAPGEARKVLLSRFCNEAKVIVVHDTEPGAEYVYGMAEALSTFKYRLDYQPEDKPHTTAVSNFIDVTKWLE